MYAVRGNLRLPESFFSITYSQIRKHMVCLKSSVTFLKSSTLMITENICHYSPCLCLVFDYVFHD